MDDVVLKPDTMTVPDVSMSYELYPHLLEWEGGDREGLADLASRLKQETSEKRSRKLNAWPERRATTRML